MSNEWARAARCSRTPIRSRWTWFAARTLLIARSSDVSARVRLASAGGEATSEPAAASKRARQVVTSLCSPRSLPCFPALPARDPSRKEKRGQVLTERHRLRCRHQDEWAPPARPSEMTGRHASFGERSRLSASALCERDRDEDDAAA